MAHCNHKYPKIIKLWLYNKLERQQAWAKVVVLKSTKWLCNKIKKWKRSFDRILLWTWILKVEKAIKFRNVGTNKEHFVKWLNWPTKYNSWVKENCFKTLCIIRVICKRLFLRAVYCKTLRLSYLLICLGYCSRKISKYCSKFFIAVFSLCDVFYCIIT